MRSLLRLKAQQHREYKGQHYASLRVSLFDEPRGTQVHAGPVEVIKPFSAPSEQQEPPVAETKPVKRTTRKAKADA